MLWVLLSSKKKRFSGWYVKERRKNILWSMCFNRQKGKDQMQPDLGMWRNIQNKIGFGHVLFLQNWKGKKHIRIHWFEGEKDLGIFCFPTWRPWLTSGGSQYFVASPRRQCPRWSRITTPKAMRYRSSKSAAPTLTSALPGRGRDHFLGALVSRHQGTIFAKRPQKLTYYITKHHLNNRK